ncbi:MAG: hypothetical protein R3F29_07715 [Planctomycetota bacterium]
MSDENENLIEDTFITKLGAKYPFIKAKNCNTIYGIKAFPSFFGIDPDGNVFSTADDRMPSEAQIEEMLKRVTLAPKMPEGAQYDPVRTLWKKKDYQKLGDYLDKMLAQENLDADMRQVFEAQKATLEKRAESQQKRVAALGQGPDYLAAKDSLEKIAKEWKGFEVAEQAKSELARFAADSQIKKEIAALKALDKLCSKFDQSNANQMRKLHLELPKFIKKYEGLHAAQKAQAMLGQGG